MKMIKTAKLHEHPLKLKKTPVSFHHKMKIVKNCILCCDHFNSNCYFLFSANPFLRFSSLLHLSLIQQTSIFKRIKFKNTSTFLVWRAALPYFVSMTKNLN